MKALPTQQRALIKRSALIESAIVSFNSDGYEATTAKSIASRAGVAVGTFYQYFENKDDILAVIAEQRFAHLEQNLQPIGVNPVEESMSSNDIETILYDAMNFIYDFHASDAELHQILEYRKGMDPRLRKIAKQGEAQLQQKVVMFVQSLNVKSPELVAENLFAMAEGVVHRHVFDNSTSSKDRALANAAKILAAYFK